MHILEESETCILSILLWILEIIFTFLFINRKILIISDSSDSDYSHIYGRLPIPTRGIRKFPAKPMFLRWLFLSYIFFFKMNCSNPFNIFFPFQPLGIIIDILNYYFEERFLVPMMTSKKIFCRHHTHHLHTICVTLAILLCFDVYFPINSNDYF